MPLESPVTLSNSIYKLTSIYAINISLTSLYLYITIVFSLKNCLLGDHYTLPVFMLINHFTKIDSVL